ncbi:MAG: bifunctional aldolase/short-chain dehydrogenase [Deltaproteobacteria bacterium]|nr:bifunctional aldolase/short-chain dehydrogenase [Deltaproteobacteria bacterium]
MLSRWNQADAAAAIARWAGLYGCDLALLSYSSRLIGADHSLVLHGGGNTSLKAPLQTLAGDRLTALYVKGSGTDMERIEPGGFAVLNWAPLLGLQRLATLSEADMTVQLRINQLDPSRPAPSVETLLHAFLPQRFINHSHPDVLLCLSNQREGEQLLRAAVGERVPILPYITAGFPLAKAVLQAYEQQPDASAIIVARHGLFTFGDDARRVYEQHLEIVDACARLLAARRPRQLLTPQYRGTAAPAELAAQAAPLLRGLLAEPSGNEDQPYRRWLLDWRADDDTLAFVNSAEAEALAAAGPLTPDHVIRTKPFALYLAEPAWDDAAKLRQQLQQAVADFVARYQAYVSRYTGGAGNLDPLPRVVFLPGAGAFCFGRSKREARIAADITVQGLQIKALAHALGGYESASPQHLCEMEYWSLQQAKLGSAAAQPLERQVVLITGGAGAIGYGIAKVCAEAGAHVVLTDIDEGRLAHVVARLEEAHGSGSATGITMNVSDPASVRAGFDEACRRYGGIDVVVPNAGVAHVAAVAELKANDLARVMAVNFTGTFLTIQEGIRVLRAQGLGGNIVVNASKNVFGPGKDFGAYSASKAAGHQLGKVSAIELAAEGIRVNMINADAIFSEDEVQSGLWATVGPERARSRGLKLEELPEYYRSRNLLHAKVTARHVGNAVVFFASNQTPTTGATLPVDGGVVEAFPR